MQTPRVRDVVVLGAGIGGLAAAIELASRGLSVDVLEAHEELGGRVGSVELDGVSVDTGPTTLVLPVVFDALFRLAGSSLEREIILRRPSPATRFLLPDDSIVELSVSRDETLASVERSLGVRARDELATFLAHSAHVWSVAAPRFVYDEAPGLASFRRLGASALSTLLELDARRTLDACIRRHVRTPELRRILRHLAVDQGFDPRRAPATISSIAHVELSLGAFGVEGGLRALVHALARTAERLGARFHTGVRAASIETRAEPRGQRAHGVLADDGRFFEARAVVANAPPREVWERLLLSSTTGRGRNPMPAPSTPSAWTAVLRARIAPDRAAHTIVLSASDDEELSSLFDGRVLSREPTISVCAPRLAHGAASWSSEEALVVTVAAPALATEPGRDADTPSAEAYELEALAARVMATLRARGVTAAGDRSIWQRSPRELALRFPGTGGSLHGAPSTDLRAAWRRPANRVPGVRGLYLASGGAHPGGGVPMAALSGSHAARALAEDLASAS